MNRWQSWGLWIGGMLIGIAIGMFAEDVRAETANVQRGGSFIAADLDNWVQKYCSEQSIQGSEAAVQRAKQQGREAMQSINTTPEVRMLSRIDLSIRVMSLENLVAQCALLKALSPGV